MTKAKTEQMYHCFQPDMTGIWSVGSVTRVVKRVNKHILCFVDQAAFHPIQLHVANGVQERGVVVTQNPRRAALQPGLPQLTSHTDRQVLQRLAFSGEHTHSPDYQFA